MNAPAATLPARAPWYRASGREKEILRVAAAQGLPVLLKGPTGCGKSRFVEAMAADGPSLIHVRLDTDVISPRTTIRAIREAARKG